MSLSITSLNSGSNGNCYYIGNENEAVLVDAGICCKEVELRMSRLGLKIDLVKAIFISHEHTDHISGLSTLVKKFQIPVYITPDTLSKARISLPKHLIKTFSANHSVSIGEISVTAFPKFHDASDPCSFIISCKQINVGVFTDVGQVCPNLKKHFKQCHAAFLEANYDEQMLEQGRYPFFLKHRIRSGNGHLSNTQALSVFTEHRPLFMSHLFLSHLSKNNNCPKLVQQLFKKQAGDVKILIATRYKETDVYHISNSSGNIPVRYSSAQLAFAFT